MGKPRTEKNNSTKQSKKVPLQVISHIRVLHQDYGWRIADIHKLKYPNIARRTINYHENIVTGKEKIEDRRKFNKGRPRLLNDRQGCRLKNTLKSLRRLDSPNFSAVKLSTVCQLNEICSVQTVRWRLKELGHHYLNTRQKGIITKSDKRLRRAFAKKCSNAEGLWKEKISFYYDAATFYHERDPYSEVVAPNSKIWRMDGEGLEITRKGKKEGNSGRPVKLFVAIAYQKGVIMCEQWDPNTPSLGIHYKEFVKKHFPVTFECSVNPKNKLVLQEGCPVQKSKQAQLRYAVVNCKVFSIPPRSPELNPIENMFLIVR